ncbi:MAG: polyhydroxyalkanoate synthesis regulator DNA-binding domain-containing protein [Myxococcota bacterium]
MSNSTTEEPSVPGKRVIKRYSNRKLYDTTDSRYVTLNQIGEMVRSGDDVQIIDNKTKEDKTEVTLALILSEDLKNKPRSVPLHTLRNLIQERGERALTSLRETPIGRLIPAEGEPASEPPVPQPEPAPEPEPESDEKEKKSSFGELVSSSRQTLDQLQASFDERMKALLPSLTPMQDIRTELQRLSARLDAIEKHLGITPNVEGEAPGDDG